MSDMDNRCLNDLNYIPLNYEQKEPTQRDIVCHTSRWTVTHRGESPKKVLRLLSDILDLQTFVQSSHMQLKMIGMLRKVYEEPVRCNTRVDGKAWKDFDTKSYKLVADIYDKTYNLPPWLCMKESSFMLTLLIPGPKSPGKDIDVYLRPLIDDLKDLWAKPGVETIDVATGLKFNMRAMVLWTINDFSCLK
ncbi:hypothetical protein Tco_1494320 [Tanacetum coccineum]